METQFPHSKDILITEDGCFWHEFILDEKMPLMVAVVFANKTVIEEQISAGADINAVDKSGHTALHWAVKFENILADAVDILLKHGANVAARDNAGRTPLHYAVRLNVKIVKTSNVKCVFVHGYSREDAASKLLDAGADANAQDIRNCTPLHSAVQDGAVAVVKVLLSHCKTNVNARSMWGMTALIFAVDIESSGSMIALLIEAGADINLKDNTEATPLHVAAELNDVDAMQTLLRYGADREKLDVYGRTMLHSILWMWENDDAVEHFLDTLLQEANTNLNSSASDGMTLLMTAASRTTSRVVEKLIIAGAAVDTADSDGNTALHWAVRADEMNIVSVLLEHGANINAQNNRGQTALFLAAQNGIAEICRLLLSKFAEIYIRDHMGRLPIDAANEGRHADVVFLLNRQPPAAG